VSDDDPHHTDGFDPVETQQLIWIFGRLEYFATVGEDRKRHQQLVGTCYKNLVQTSTISTKLFLPRFV
jgi:hypothetical protein